MVQKMHVTGNPSFVIVEIANLSADGNQVREQFVSRINVTTMQEVWWVQGLLIRFSDSSVQVKTGSSSSDFILTTGAEILDQRESRDSDLVLYSRWVSRILAV